MAQKWQNNDSARTMTKKYNEMVDQINQYEENNQITAKVAEELRQLLGGKLDKETAKIDLGVDKIDNTSDMDKPLSNPQARAIENAMDGMLTSEPIETMDVGVPPIGVLAEVYMFGTKLVMNTDVNTITQKISVFITDTQLALVTT